MKKEKQVRSYKRRTKSGKIVTVKAHTAKYDAADEKAKEVSKKPGAGKELEERKKKPVRLEPPFDKEEEKKVLDEVKETTKKESEKKPSEKKTTKKVRPVGSGTNVPAPKKKSDMKVAKTETAKLASSEPAFTAAEFKEWYRGTGSAVDKKVAKALRAQLGRSGYRKLEDEAINNYSSRGHLSMFKRVGGGTSTNVGSSKSKDVHPRKLTDEQLRSKMKESKNYIFGKDGKIYYKNSKGRKSFEVTIEGYRRGLLSDYKENKSFNSLSKVTKEYGFSKSDVERAARFGGGATKPYRRKDEVNTSLAKKYAKFEGISTRDAIVELMMAKPSEYRRYMKSHGASSSTGNESKA